MSDVFTPPGRRRLRCSRCGGSLYVEPQSAMSGERYRTKCYACGEECHVWLHGRRGWMPLSELRGMRYVPSLNTWMAATGRRKVER